MGDFPYNQRRKVQYIIRYHKNGFWYTEYFSSPERAAAFRMRIRNDDGVDAVSRIGTIYN